LLLLGPTVVRSGSELLQQHLSQVQLTADAPEYHLHLVRQSVLKMAVMLGPWLLGLCATAYAVQVIQIGWLWLPRNVVPDPQRIAPGRVVQRWLEPAQLFRLLLLTLKLVCVLVAAGWLLREHLPTVQSLGRMTPADLLQVGRPTVAADQRLEQPAVVAVGACWTTPGSAGGMNANCGLRRTTGTKM